MHPHPSPLPSRERRNWIESMSIFEDKYLLHKKIINVLLGLICATREALPAAGIRCGKSHPGGT
jgi:hypothetical protein